MANTRRASSTAVPARLAVSSIVGSRPSSCSSSRETLRTRDMVSTMCTGMRIVRLWSATARVIAWRIHQVA